MGVVVPSEAEVMLAVGRLAALGYVHRGDLGIDGREAFYSPADWPEHHLYVFRQGNAGLANHLAVRNQLRKHPGVAAAYGELKKRLAQQFRDDVDSYVDGKTDFLLGILQGAGFPAEMLAAIEAANRKAT